MPSSVHDDHLPGGTAIGRSGPALEAVERWLDAELAGQPVPPLVVAIGLGDGELLDVLARRAPATRVLALEPDPAAARRFGQRDWRAWRESGRLAYLLDPDYAGADEAWRMFPPSPDDHKLLVWPGVSRDQAAVRAIRVAKQIIFGAKANADARRRFAPRYLSATLHNLPEIVRGHDVRVLTNAFAGVPAIIAAAGPSLDDNLDDLARVRGRGLVIAADTALRPLVLHGVVPELVVAVDPGAANARHFQSLRACPDTWLVSEASIDPRVIEPFGDRAFWFRVSNHEPWPWLGQRGLDIGQVDVWGSVLTAAFQIAILAGCDPIVIVGADLSFTRGQPYARGTTYEFDWAHAAAEGSTLADAWRPFLKPDDQTPVPGVGGADAVSTGVLRSFRDWTVARAKKSGRRVINATGAGILIGDGIEQRPLRDALPQGVTVPALSAIAGAAAVTRDPAALSSHLAAVRGVQRGKDPLAPPLAQWRQFAGEGFDAVAIAAAIDRAIAVLGSRAGPARSSGDLVPWQELGARPGSVDVFRHLPESVARLRAAFEHRDPGPRPGSAVEPAAQREALLEDALIVLAAMWADAESPHQEDLPIPVPAVILGRAPLGALRNWPQRLGWSVRLFEGLLGQVMAHPVSADAAESGAYFSRAISPRSPRQETKPATTRALPHLHHAQVLLALEWVLAAVSSQAASPSAFDEASAWWRQLGDVIGAPLERIGPDFGVSVAIDSGAGSWVEVGVAASPDDLTRVLTGALRPEVDGELAAAVADLARTGSPRRFCAVGVRLPGSGATARRLRPRHLPLVRPRVLSEADAPKALLAYAADAGAVCTTRGGHETFVVCEDGVIVPGLSWPRPIDGQLPIGAGGVVAWGATNAVFPSGGTGYVMHRSGPHVDPQIHELPFAPQVGCWWRDRIWWACFPFGVGSWAPGGQSTHALGDLTLFSVLADGDQLALGPRHRSPTGAAERRLLTDGWAWDGTGAPRRVALGHAGVATSRSDRFGWTALAHAEADLVRFEHTSGATLAMTCAYPFGVAWAGRSLVVCTADGDVLFFDRIADVLDEHGGVR